MQVVADFQVNGLFPATVGGTGTTVKYFPRNVASAAGASWVAAPATPSSTSPVGALWVPGDNKLNGQHFRVNVSGSAIAGASAGSETVTFGLYAVTGSLASPTYTLLNSSAVLTPAVDGVQHNFSIVADMFGNTDSGIVGGSQYTVIDNTVTATAALASSLTGINFGSGNTSLYQAAPFGLVVGVTFSVSNSANAAKLYQFNIEA